MMAMAGEGVRSSSWPLTVAGHLHIAALRRKLHIGDLDAQQVAAYGILREGHLQGGALDRHLSIHGLALEPVKHGHAGAGSVEGAVLGQLEGHTRDGLALVHRGFPGETGIDAANDP